MPYGFYQFTRYAGHIGVTILAFKAHEQGRHAKMIIYGGLALWNGCFAISVKA
jgi:hypothetical protein